jgi:hypothetical protein
MRRVAVHRIYLSAKQTIDNGVVVLDNEFVEKVFPLTEEIEKTEWIGGAVFLSSFNHIEKLNEIKTIEEAIEKMTVDRKESDSSYAWHASKVDFRKGILLSENRWTKLTS